MPSHYRNNTKAGNCYKDFPELYDILYARYLRSIPDFVKLVENNTPPRGAILDIAAGTGEVTIPLLKQGYHVTALDVHGGMLKELEQKAARQKLRNYSLMHKNMSALAGHGQFDTVCIRQAINYLPSARALKNGFAKMYAALKPGGALVFNAPNFTIATKHYPPVHSLYEKDGLSAFVLETNALRKRTLTHRQNAILWSMDRAPHYITDANIFYMYTKDEFADALTVAGFRKITFLASGLTNYDKKSKTLYCVAKK